MWEALSPERIPEFLRESHSAASGECPKRISRWKPLAQVENRKYSRDLYRRSDQVIRAPVPGVRT